MDTAPAKNQATTPTAPPVTSAPGNLPSTERSSPALAALVNGTAAHALDYDDVNWAMQGHPSAPLLPALLASAQIQGSSGAELVLAYVAGFEVEARVGEGLARSHYARGWHPTATAGLFGAAAGSGRLLGLSETQLRAAFGTACSRAAGTRMNFGTDTKPLQVGLAARAGVECAQLAGSGLSARLDGLKAEGMAIPQPSSSSSYVDIPA